MISPSDMRCMSLDVPLPLSPEYRCGSYGDWELRFKPGNTFERGYFSSWGAEPPGYYIIKDNLVWMSTSRLELESHAIHLNDAHGTVVMCGVGMGMYLFNLAAKPEVKAVIAVDVDQAVIDLVHDATGFKTWVGHEKIKFVRKNALDLLAADIGTNPVDYLYVDIWQELGNSLSLSQTQAIQRIVGARRVGWWGQEIDFIQWIFENRPAGYSPLPSDLLKFTEATGLPLAEQSVRYLIGCQQAGKVYSSYGSLPFALASR